MANQAEIAKTRLYGEGGLGVRDIKLHPGESRDVTSEQLAEQVNRAISQLETGDYELVEEFDD